MVTIIFEGRVFECESVILLSESGMSFERDYREKLDELLYTEVKDEDLKAELDKHYTSYYVEFN